MKFKEIQRFVGGTTKDILRFIRQELQSNLKNLYVGLNKLNFTDNFDGFVYEGTIAAATTVTITNPLGQIPFHRVILRLEAKSAGTIAIDDSETAWTSDAVYLRNQGTASVLVRAIFIR